MTIEEGLFTILHFTNFVESHLCVTVQVVAWPAAGQEVQVGMSI